MSLNVWFREDVSAKMRAVDLAAGDTLRMLESTLLDAESLAFLRGYRLGHAAAIRALSAAFGLEESTRGRGE
jgi:hypothetical protein